MVSYNSTFFEKLKNLIKNHKANKNKELKYYNFKKKSTL